MSDEMGDSPKTILVAEDEFLIARHMGESLRSLGYEVIGPVGDGEQAIEAAKEQRPDLALLDIKLPVMDGLKAAEVLFCQMSIPVVLVSGYADEEYIEAGSRIGVFGYILKPVNADSLRVNLSVAWSRYQKHSDQRSEIRDLKTSLENRKIIESAKGILMEKLSLTEDQAMKRLQKQARDARRKLVDTASMILETRDLFENQKNDS